MVVNVFRISSASSSVHAKEQVHSSSIMSPSSCLDARLHTNKLHSLARYGSEETCRPRKTSRSDCACCATQHQQRPECQTQKCQRHREPNEAASASEATALPHRMTDYGTMTPSSSSSTGITSNRVNIIRNRFFSYSDGHGDVSESTPIQQQQQQQHSVGQYGFESDHSQGCDKRWIRMRSSKSDCCRCSGLRGRARRKGICPPGEMSEEAEAEEEEGDPGEEEDCSIHQRHLKGGQRWRNVKAVMAYYYALRKIKRNVAFVSGHPSPIAVTFNGCCVLSNWMSTVGLLFVCSLFPCSSD